MEAFALEISDDKREIARHLRTAFDGRCEVYAFYDEDESTSVDIVICDESPAEGVQATGTVGLSDYDFGIRAHDLPLRVELVMAGRPGQLSIPNVLATCAFAIVNEGYKIEPGLILPGVISMYNPGSRTRHGILLAPASWLVSNLRFSDKIVTFLQVVPISDKERQLAEDRGSITLEKALEREEADIYDFDRLTVI